MFSTFGEEWQLWRRYLQKKLLKKSCLPSPAPLLLLLLLLSFSDYLWAKRSRLNLFMWITMGRGQFVSPRPTWQKPINHCLSHTILRCLWLGEPENPLQDWKMLFLVVTWWIFHWYCNIDPRNCLIKSSNNLLISLLQAVENWTGPKGQCLEIVSIKLCNMCTYYGNKVNIMEIAGRGGIRELIFVILPRKSANLDNDVPNMILVKVNIL